MTISDIITSAGAVVTLLGAGVTIQQTKKAFSYSQSAKDARDAALLNSVAERLKTAQDHIREVAPEKLSRRGYDVAKRIDSIRREFDASLGALPKGGLAKGARQRLSVTQGLLNTYQASIGGTLDRSAWEKMQKELQDTISELTSRSLEKS